MDVATGAFASVLPKLDKLLNGEYELQPTIREDIKILSQEMESMQATLRMLGDVPGDQLDPQVKIWAAQVRELSYIMQDVLDELLMPAPISEGFMGLIKKMGNLLKTGNTQHQIITSAIRFIKVQVHRVVERKQRYNIDDEYRESRTAIDPRMIALYRKREELVGIDGEKDQELMTLLSDGRNVPNNKMIVVSVVGIGGVGKTTLVKSVYDNIPEFFDCTAFVPAGQNADAKKVIEDIIFCLDISLYRTVSVLDKQQVAEKLLGILQNKRYLIVIDDIWDQVLWEDIKGAFPKENNFRSRIITTTRIISVAKACCSSPNDSVYQMEPLSDVDSKQLLYQRLFAFVGEFHDSFEQVPGDILKKCGGLPLAIILACSVLEGERPEDWGVIEFTCRMLETVAWEDTRRILSLSYYDLPPHLRTCLLYFCTFSESNAIEGDRLVKKLIAEGIVNQESKNVDMLSSQKLSLQETAIKYLDELANRNVIHPLECNNYCEVIAYHIHPMMLTVLKAIAIEERFAASLDEKDISSAHPMNIRHISINCPDSENPNQSSSMASHRSVRSLTVFGHANRLLHWKFQSLLVLDLEGCHSIEKSELEYICTMVLLKQLCLAKTQITELPPQIGNLQYLEGLDIGGTQITKLPTQVSKLQQLKTLDARKSGVMEIPDQVVRLTRLTRLLIGDNESCEGVKLPDGIGKMTSLQQLGTIDLRKCSASSLKELSELKYLKEIAVVSSDDTEDTKMNNILVSSLDKSTELRSLVVYSDFKLSTRLQSSSLYKYLNCRKKLIVVTSFKVPVGFAGQQFLGMLDIRVCKIEEDDLKILRDLPITPVSISCEGFAELESFCVDCRMPRVIFEKGAMPKLGHLELKMYAGSASRKHMDIKHLLNLQEVRLRYFNWYATNNGVKETTDAVKTEAKEHQNEITLCIAEENKDGTCTIKSEIFPENKDACCSLMTETEGEVRHAVGTGYFLNGEHTQEGVLRQSSFAIGSCSGTKEIEEVVE